MTKSTTNYNGSDARVFISSIIATLLIDRVKVLRPTRNKMGHFGHVPRASLLAWYGKIKLNQPQRKHTFTYYQNKCTTTQYKRKRTKARFSHLLRHPV